VLIIITISFLASGALMPTLSPPVVGKLDGRLRRTVEGRTYRCVEGGEPLLAPKGGLKLFMISLMTSIRKKPAMILKPIVL
jgi:hypothetical protein